MKFETAAQLNDSISIDDKLELQLIEDGIEQAATYCYCAAVKSGWWTDFSTGNPIPAEIRKRDVPTKLMLIVSEIAEAMEAHRKDLKDDKLPWRDGLEVELADAAIRIFDLAGSLGYDIAGAIVEKLVYNSTREDHKIETRKATGGKAY